MNNIIIFFKYNRGENNMRFEELLKNLRVNKINNHEYSLSEIDDVAKTILSEIDYYPKEGATPIVRIAKDFDFKTYKETLPNNLSGDIYINGDTAKEYNHDKVILVNKNEELFHQRFVIAHELAHYLFDFIGNPYYQDISIKFSDTYYKNKHETLQEKRANRFAASILMPRELFIKQYNYIKSIDSNRIFVITYLSRFFETSIDSIEKRILEV